MLSTFRDLCVLRLEVKLPVYSTVRTSELIVFFLVGDVDKVFSLSSLTF